MGLDISLTDVFICNIDINTSGTYIYILLSNNYLIIVNNSTTYSSTNLNTTVNITVNTSIVSQTLTCDSTGQYVGICTIDGFYISIDYGISFTKKITGFFSSCCAGDDGIFLAVQTNQNTLISILYKISLFVSSMLYTSPIEPNNILSVNGNINTYYFNPAWNDTASNDLYCNTINIIAITSLNVSYVDNTGQYVGIITGTSFNLSGASGADFEVNSYFTTNSLYPTTMNSTNDSLGNYFVFCCSYLNSTNFNIYTTINGGSTVTLESEIPQATSMPYICCTNGCNSSNYPIAVVASTLTSAQCIYIGTGNTASSSSS